MPDLLRNADQNAHIKIEHLPPQNEEAINSIILGWKKHLEVDLYFHSSDFFKYHAHQLKLLLTPAVAGSVVKPFFLGHIALELILDNLLLTSDTVFTNDFYDHLKNADEEYIAAFLKLNNVDPQKFLAFYTSFIQEKYLYSYIKVDSIVHALKGVCSRIWKNPFTKPQEAAVNEVIEHYRIILSAHFMQIFEKIDLQLSKTC